MRSRVSVFVSSNCERNREHSRYIALIRINAIAQMSPIVLNPGVDRRNDRVSLCWSLAVKNPNRHVDHDHSVGNREGLVRLDSEKLFSKAA